MKILKLQSQTEILKVSLLAIYLTIIPQMCVGYEVLDSGQGVEHRDGYRKLSNKCEWIKSILNSIFYQLKFLAILRENVP